MIEAPLLTRTEIETVCHLAIEAGCNAYAAPLGFLEAGAEGTFGGWQPEDGGRILVPGPVAVFFTILLVAGLVALLWAPGPAKRTPIDVTSVNDAPSGSNNTLTILEDAVHTFTAADFSRQRSRSIKTHMNLFRSR